MFECIASRPRLGRAGFVFVAVFGFASLSHACLWDWDTLQMERQRFPGTLEMIIGKFVRHSLAYYEWRIQDRTKRIRSPAENPELADDLAVAYSKLGRHADGLALLEDALAAHPDCYETLANLGTIYMLGGDLTIGKDYIDRAIEINPNAHFGREKYQSLLAEYFLTERKQPHPASESVYVNHPKGEYHGFAKFVLEQRGRNLSKEEIDEELAAAQKGVLGMMHFANYDSPLLLEALGDLLIAWPTYQQDALQLAARAYYRIAQLSDDESTRAEFEAAAKNILFGSYDFILWRDEQREKFGKRDPDDLTKLAGDLERELAEARVFVAAIEADEKRWIAEGIDVDQAFAAKYYDSLDEMIDAAKQQLANEPRDVRGNPYDEAIRRGLLILGGCILALIALVAGAVMVYRRLRSRRVEA